MTEPAPPEVYIPALQNHIRAVNDAPHGLSTTRSTAYWAETNGFLNALAWVSGSTRPRRFMGGTPAPSTIAALHHGGLRYIALLPEQMAGPELAEETTAFLDGHLPRISEDERMIVWEVRP